MNKYDGYPVVPCPTCGASDQVRIVRPFTPSRELGPGERAWFACGICPGQWLDIVPEPPDRYEGDGVYAENH